MRRSYGLVWFFALVFSKGFLLTAWAGIAMEVADGPFETADADPSIRILAEPSQKGAGPQGPPVAKAVGGVRVDSFPHPTLGSYEVKTTWSVGFLETSEGRLWWSFGSSESPSVELLGSYVGCLASEEGIVLYTSGSCASWFAYGGESNKMRPGETRADMDRRSSAGLALMRAGGEVVDQLEFAPDSDFDGEGLKRLIRGAAAISIPRLAPKGTRPWEEGTLEKLAGSSTYAPCMSMDPEKDCLRIYVSVWTGGWRNTSFPNPEDKIFGYEHSAVRICISEWIFDGTPREEIRDCYSAYSHGTRVPDDPIVVTKSGDGWEPMTPKCSRPYSAYVEKDTVPYLHYCGSTRNGWERRNDLFSHERLGHLGTGSGDYSALSWLGKHNCHDDSFVLMQSAILGKPSRTDVCTDKWGRPRAPVCHSFDYNQFAKCGPGCDPGCLNLGNLE